jgi:hypothetical protein
MTIKQAVVTSAFASLAALPTITFAAPATPDPIVINHVQVQPTGNSFGAGFVTVTFTNTSSVTATEVVFELSGAGGFQRINDVGTFTPGVQITHGFLYYAHTPNENVKVAEVDFADGTIWADGQITTSHSRPRASSNDPLSLAPL